jgi:hypothetical protein
MYVPSSFRNLSQLRGDEHPCNSRDRSLDARIAAVISEAETMRGSAQQGDAPDGGLRPPAGDREAVMCTKRFITVLCVTLGLACGEERVPVQPATDYLAGSVWRLAAVEDRFSNVIFTPAPNERYEIKFLAGGQAQVRTSCFECTGSYHASTGPAFPSVAFSLPCGEVACDPALGYATYVADLNSAVEGGVLLNQLRVLVEGSWHQLVHVRLTEGGT